MASVIRSSSRLTNKARSPAAIRSTLQRRCASQSNGPSTGPVSSNLAGSSRKPYIFIGGAVVFVMVAGRYILASSKEAGSGQAEQQKLRRENGTSQEYRDPRDSGVKTLEQRRQKEQSS